MRTPPELKINSFLFILGDVFCGSSKDVFLLKTPPWSHAIKIG